MEEASIDHMGVPQEWRKHLSAENDGVSQELRTHLHTMKGYHRNEGSIYM